MIDFTFDGYIATIHFFTAGAKGAGHGKMIFDFLLSRFPVVSTGVEGENISYPAVRRLYTMQQSGDYAVKSTGVKTSVNTGFTEAAHQGRLTGKKTLKPNTHYYVAKSENETMIPKPVETSPGGMFGVPVPKVRRRQ